MSRKKGFEASELGITENTQPSLSVEDTPAGHEENLVEGFNVLGTWKFEVPKFIGTFKLPKGLVEGALYQRVANKVLIPDPLAPGIQEFAVITPRVGETPTTQEIEERLRRSGYRAAYVKELIAFAAAHPQEELLKGKEILSIGNVIIWNDESLAGTAHTLTPGTILIDMQHAAAENETWLPDSRFLVIRSTP